MGRELGMEDGGEGLETEGGIEGGGGGLVLVLVWLEHGGIGGRPRDREVVKWWSGEVVRW